MDVKTSIFVTTQKIGYHAWFAAPAEVDFLRNVHRHIFYIKVWIELLEHNDREIEFFMFKRLLNTAVSRVWDKTGLGSPKNKAGYSCEMLADNLYFHIQKEYPNRTITIEVNEDNENGAVKTYPSKSKVI